MFLWDLSELRHSQTELRLIESVIQHNIYAHLNVHTASWLFYFCVRLWIWPCYSHKRKTTTTKKYKTANPLQDWVQNTWPNLKQKSHWFQSHCPKAKGPALLPVKSVVKLLRGTMWFGCFLYQSCIRKTFNDAPISINSISATHQTRTKILFLKSAKLKLSNYYLSFLLVWYCWHWLQPTCFRFFFLLLKILLFTSVIATHFYLDIKCLFFFLNVFLSLFKHNLSSQPQAPSSVILEAHREHR